MVVIFVFGNEATLPKDDNTTRMSKGQAKITSMNSYNCVSDLMSDLMENTGYAALSIYILLLQLPYILALFKHD